MLRFNEETHTYDEDGKKLISVTQLLTAVGIAEPLDKVDQEKLRRSAERGTLVHGEIHDYLVKGNIGFTAELESFIEWLAVSEYVVVESEGMVNDDVVAGTLDLLIRNRKTGEYAIADFKTTSEPHVDTTSFQTSIYAYLYEKTSLGEVTIPKVFMLWFDRNGKITEIPLMRQPNEKIERVIDCYLKGEKFTEQEPTITEQITRLEDIENLLRVHKAEMEIYEKKEAEIKKALVKAMEENGIYKFQGETLSIAYVKAGTRNTFDSKKLKAEHPDIYEQYVKTSETAPSVRITLKKEKEKDE